MKIKINLKLTAFLVSLFLSLILVIVGSKNQFCLSFGFMLMGASLVLFIWYNNDKTQKEIENISREIDEVEKHYEDLIEADYEDLSDEAEHIEEERAYILQQLYIRKSKLGKNKKKSIIVFSMCGFALIILGFVGLF